MKKFLRFTLSVFFIIMVVAFTEVRVPAKQCPDGMVSYWRLDEGLGQTASDSIITNHGILGGTTNVDSNDPTWTDGIINKALSFDGDDYVDCGNDNSLNIANEITIYSWIKPSAEQLHRENTVLIKGTSHPNYGVEIIRSWPTDYYYNLVFMYSDGIYDNYPQTYNTPIIPNTWNFISITYGYGEIKFYVNGQLQRTTTLSYAMAPNNGKLIFGNRDQWKPFVGIIDEVAIFNKTLSEVEIGQHYQNGLLHLGYCDKSNNPPIAICKNVTIEAGGSCRADASIDNGSYDPDDDPITIIQDPLGPYPLGITDVTLSVEDDHDNTSTCNGIVTVIDTTPPVITDVSASSNSLWPPNHKMVDVMINYNSADNCGNTICTLNVTSNEPVNGTGDGDLAPDWEIVGANDVKLRAERSGSGIGRIYTIIITCTDEFGNSSHKEVSVNVPHDQGEPGGKQK